MQYMFIQANVVYTLNLLNTVCLLYLKYNLTKKQKQNKMTAPLYGTLQSIVIKSQNWFHSKRNRAEGPYPQNQPVLPVTTLLLKTQSQPQLRNGILKACGFVYST